MSRITRKGVAKTWRVIASKALQKRYVAKVRESREKSLIAYLPCCVALPWSKCQLLSLSSVYQLSTSNYLPDITFRRLSFISAARITYS